ncbi:MAG: molecular chaperone DnaJ [Candidatus Hydrogenedentota bacterium]
MPQQDLYEILGVSRDASQDEIRKAYLKLAHKYHPDKTGGDTAAEERLKEINAAYDVLKNPEKRGKYDRFGSAEGSPFGGGGSPFGGGGSPFGGGGDFDDLFDMLFGSGGGRRRSAGPRAQPGNDLELRMRVSLEEAATGVKRTVRFNRMENCGECGGSGAAPGSKPETCPQCQGAGQVRVAQGFFSVTRPCPKCAGSGRIISQPCRNCSNGRVRTNREINVDIPAGISSDARLRVSGEGEPGAFGGHRGDLYILVEVQRHDLFDRQGNDLHCAAPITIAQAALGDTISVPTIASGPADLKIPAGTQSGAQLRLRGMGMPDVRGYRTGDQIVTVHIETPVKLNRQQRNLLKELEEASSEKNYPRHQDFARKIKT